MYIQATAAVIDKSMISDTSGIASPLMKDSVNTGAQHSRIGEANQSELDQIDYSNDSILDRHYAAQTATAATTNNIDIPPLAR
jgi:hypothetical protein